MQRLADVELQLVMQGLAAQEILKLARCSRYLLHAADAPFAWRHTRLCVDASHGLSLLPPTPPSIALPQRIIGWCQSMLIGHKTPIETPRLSRHAKVTIKWSPQEVSHSGILEIAARVAAIYEINACWTCFDDDQYDPYDGDSYDPYGPKLMSLVFNGSPSIQQLRVLSIRGNTRLHPVVVQTIIKLPHLHTLRLIGCPDNCRDSAASGLGLLYRAPALTSLYIRDSPNHYNSRLAHVAACSKLLDLSISRPCLYGPYWVNFFAHPHIQQLRSLYLDEFHVRRERYPYSYLETDPTQQEFQLAFASMRHLHTLHLAKCRHIDLMLPAVAHAPALRHLTIEPDLIATTAPSNLVLATLLAAAPQLHCVLVLKPMLVPENKYYVAIQLALQTRFESDPVLVASDRFTIQFNQWQDFR